MDAASRGSGASCSRTRSTGPWRGCGWAVTYAVETSTKDASRRQLRATSSAASAPPVFTAVASASGRLNSTDAAQWITCVTSAAARSRTSGARPSPARVRSPATASTLSCQPGSCAAKQREPSTSPRSLSLACAASLARTSASTRDTPSSARRRISSSSTTFPTKPVAPVSSTTCDPEDMVIERRSAGSENSSDSWQRGPAFSLCFARLRGRYDSLRAALRSERAPAWALAACGTHRARASSSGIDCTDGTPLHFSLSARFDPAFRPRVRDAAS